MNRCLWAGGIVTAGILGLLPVTGHAQSIVPYGFVRFDGIFDDSRMNSVQSASWVQSETDDAENDKELSLHPRLSRFGFDIQPVEVDEGVTASGKIEIDFQAGGSSESRPALRMRHAYAQFAMQSGVELLIGQNWELISPLMPSANSDALMWNAGNAGDRRPQIRLTFRPKVSGDSKIRLAGALGMPNAINNQDADGNGQLDGLDAAVPIVQLLAEVSTPKVTLGGWFHYGVDKLNTKSGDEEVNSMLVGGHVKAALSEKVSVQGEAFFGQHASDVRAGIGQSLVPDPDDPSVPMELATVGGWAEVGIQATKAYKVVLGASMDKPNEDDLDGLSEARTSNMTAFFVNQWKMWNRTTFGVDYVFWKTEYKSGNDGAANRLNGYMVFTF